jgi:hypothetical protein
LLFGHASIATIATIERYTAVDDDEIRAAIMAASVGLPPGIGASVRRGDRLARPVGERISIDPRVTY